MVPAVEVEALQRAEALVGYMNNKETSLGSSARRGTGNVSSSEGFESNGARFDLSRYA